MFETLIHADWSVSPKKRYQASATRKCNGWVVAGPNLVGTTSEFLERAFSVSSLLLGFDFPIGLPQAYGATTLFSSFPEALTAFGTAPWSNFFNIAETAEEISTHRPFYPRGCAKGVRKADLVAGLAVEQFSDLLRICERSASGGKTACSVFWTLGGNQVGRGAISGWQEIVSPAIKRGAKLWPFDGSLHELARGGGVVVAETYPSLAYRMVGAGFSSRESKRNQTHRASKAQAILHWTDQHRVDLDSETRAATENGFGSGLNGEDAFDALLGLFKMIEVADGRRPAATVQDSPPHWEGWILGR